MFRKLCVLCILAVLAIPATAFSQIPTGCNFIVEGPLSLTGHFLVCPAGDGDLLSDHGGPIVTHAFDNNSVPIAGIPAADYWLIGCSDGLVLCGGSQAIDADAASDAFGEATISGAFAGAGCDTGFKVVVQGVIGGRFDDCMQDMCVTGQIVSVDHNGDLVVDLIDFSLFAPVFTGGYDACFDYNGDGLVDLIDLTIFAAHWTHACL